MKILTIGDSWTWGGESSDPETMSWPALMAKKYNVEVTNLARPGCSNKRSMRICVEEVCRNNVYDLIIFPLGPASRTEILKNGKWHQVWPNDPSGSDADQLFTEYWHPWNDVQNTILECFYFFNTIKNLNITLLATCLSFLPRNYNKELSWIVKYNNDYNFNSLGMPLSDLNIGPDDLHRKLTCLKALHDMNIQCQSEYLLDVDQLVLNQEKKFYARGGHPNDIGYGLLADYFGQKIKKL